MNNNNLTVYKHNAVIEAGYKISLNEQRVVLACIGQVDSTKKLLATDEFELSAKEFATMFEVSEKRAYQALVEVTENLFNRYIVIKAPFPHKPNIEKLKTRWISSIAYNKTEGKIVLQFAQQILPYLSSLEKCFTKYELKHISKMTSIYGIRLYELIMQWKTTGKREISIEWLKEQFQLDESYDRMFDLKKRVIDPAVDDINKYSNFNLVWEQRKTGRKVTHLVFTFTEKKQELSQEKETQKTLSISATEINDDIFEKLKKLFGETYNLQLACKLLESFPIDIQNDIVNVLSNKWVTIDKPISYLRILCKKAQEGTFTPLEIPPREQEKLLNTAAQEKKAQDLEITHLRNELENVKRLNQAFPNPALDQQITVLKQKLEEKIKMNN